MLLKATMDAFRDRRDDVGCDDPPIQLHGLEFSEESVSCERSESEEGHRSPIRLANTI
jgi:hypothetical protein